MLTCLLYGFGGFLYFKIATAWAFDGYGMNLVMSALMAIALVVAVIAVGPYYAVVLGRERARALDGRSSRTLYAMLFPTAGQLGGMLLAGYLLAVGFDQSFVDEIEYEFWIYAVISTIPVAISAGLTWIAIESSTWPIREQFKRL